MNLRFCPSLIPLSSLLAAAFTAVAASPDAPAGATNSSEVRLKWNRKTLVEAYNTIGERDPKWDKDARAALEAFARVRTDPNGPVLGIVPKVTDAARKAVEAGCTDPMVGYLHTRYVSAVSARSPAAVASLYDQAAQALLDSRYHPLRKAYACGWALTSYEQAAPSPRALPQQVPAYRAAIHTNTAAALSDSTMTADEAYDLCDVMFDYLEKSPGIYEEFFVPIEPILTRHWGKDYRLPLLRGRVLFEYAWRGRGTAIRDETSAEQFKLLRERRAQAVESLQAAWKLNQSDARIPDAMLRTFLGTGKSREEYEEWFNRAMKLDPANYLACTTKLYYLEPKWHGSVEEMLEFGRQCVTTRRWKGHVPLVLADAHDALAQYETADQREHYWHQPAVWKDIQFCFDAFFERNPERGFMRQNYARYAYRCQEWDALLTQLSKLGQTNYAFFGGKAAFDRMAEEAHANASKSKSKP